MINIDDEAQMIIKELVPNMMNPIMTAKFVSDTIDQHTTGMSKTDIIQIVASVNRQLGNYGLYDQSILLSVSEIINKYSVI